MRKLYKLLSNLDNIYKLQQIKYNDMGIFYPWVFIFYPWVFTPSFICHIHNYTEYNEE